MTFDELKSQVTKFTTAVEDRDGAWHLTAEQEMLRPLLEAVHPVFDYPEDLTCIDEGVALRVFYRFYALASRQLLHVYVLVPREDAHLPTAADLWRGLEWHEREVFDLFGVTFDGHPDMRRILTWEGFTGHPLLKDYVVDNDDSSWQIPEQCDEEIVDLLEKT